MGGRPQHQVSWSRRQDIFSVWSSRDCARSGERNVLIREVAGLLAPALPAYLARQRWFGGKARRIDSTEILDFIPVQTDEGGAFVLVVRVEYLTGPEERYFLPMLLVAD